MRVKDWVVASINSELVLLYREIGKRIETEMIEHQCAEYREEIVTTLS